MRNLRWLQIFGAECQKFDFGLVNREYDPLFSIGLWQLLLTPTDEDDICIALVVKQDLILVVTHLEQEELLVLPLGLLDTDYDLVLGDEFDNLVGDAFLLYIIHRSH